MSSQIQHRMKEIIACEAAAMMAVEINAEFEKAALLLCATRGKVLATGIGKAGIIAHKFASTLCSTGTPAVFLHPAEAAHGDLGLIGREDCIVAFSTSGKSNEVLEALELGRHLGLAAIIGVTSHPDSRLRDLSDIVLDMGEIQEPCSLGLTPTVSIAAMLAIGDALALTVMELKGTTMADFGLRHHGGYLGRKARTDNLPTD